MLNFKKIKLFSEYLQKDIEVEIIKKFVILYVADEFWIGAKGYKLYRFDIKAQKWRYFSHINDPKRSFLSRWSLSRRFLRTEITHLYVFRDQTLICIAKRGIFKYDEKSQKFEKVFNIDRGSRPMNLCQDKEGTIYFGEYFSNPQRNPVHIYKSSSNGLIWEIAFTFSMGQINHIHGIFRDPYTENLFVVTGDKDYECLIGYSDDGFVTLKVLFRGKQNFRACNLLFYKDIIVFATDTQYEQNNIRSIDRKTNTVNDIYNLRGSGIYGGKSHKFAYISTTVEPSKVNLDRNSYLCFSLDGQHWRTVLSFQKDYLKDTIFQFGSIRFPEYAPNCKTSSLIITGRALNTIDGNSLIINTELFT